VGCSCWAHWPLAVRPGRKHRGPPPGGPRARRVTPRGRHTPPPTTGHRIPSRAIPGRHRRRLLRRSNGYPLRMTAPAAPGSETSSNATAPRSSASQPPAGDGEYYVRIAALDGSWRALDSVATALEREPGGRPRPPASNGHTVGPGVSTAKPRQEIRSLERQVRLLGSAASILSWRTACPAPLLEGGTGCRVTLGAEHAVGQLALSSA
jgi:hypothetical protein